MASLVPCGEHGKYRTEMRPYYDTAQGSLGEIKDCIEDGRKRKAPSTAHEAPSTKH